MAYRVLMGTTLKIYSHIAKAERRNTCPERAGKIEFYSENVPDPAEKILNAAEDPHPVLCFYGDWYSGCGVHLPNSYNTESVQFEKVDSEK
ncbi:hypothetical protein NPIL_479831 [Nephila pilipes]|uniref:Uncharacterized protein n=1 Tax=Nephila pilipes TaxID=299642 RepID=A0A8X6SZK6_NEPPI|nr:hypothetical protein NPIL_479831 [Nephila pilipes]